MKYYLSLFALLFTALTGYSQQEELPKLEPYFTAIIVSDIDRSIQWYVEKLGFEVLNQTELKDYGIKQANLKHGTILIELIESSSAIYPKDILAEKPKRTQIAGYFKYGFAVANFEDWVKHLSDLETEFHGTVVRDDISGEKMLIIKDPDGNRVQLFEK